MKMDLKIEKKNVLSPTCTEAGSVEYWSCSDCDKLFADEDATEEITDVTVPATGHNWEDAEIVKVATYTQAGSKKQVCTECEEEQTVTLEALEYTADATVEAGESISAAIEAAQNGIQVACAATITNNTVKDMKYSADNEWAHGSVGIYVLTEEADSVTVTGNTLENVDNGIYGYVNGAVANSETAKEDNTFTDLYEEGYDFYETPAAADAE